MASCSGSGMLRIPKHSAFMLWYRTGRGTYSPWLNASSCRCRFGFAAWFSCRMLRDSKHSSNVTGSHCISPSPGCFLGVLRWKFYMLGCNFGERLNEEECGRMYVCFIKNISIFEKQWRTDF